jgi:hypothetical protein
VRCHPRPARRPPFFPSPGFPVRSARSGAKPPRKRCG